MERTIAYGCYLLGLSMLLSSLSIAIAGQSVNINTFLLGVLGLILLLNSLRSGLEAGGLEKAGMIIVSLVIVLACAWIAAGVNAPRAVLIALPISLSLSIVSLALLLRAP